MERQALFLIKRPSWVGVPRDSVLPLFYIDVNMQKL